jgi:hypothetical protein
MSNHKSACSQKLVVAQVSLMSVNDKDALPSLGMLQHQSFTCYQTIFLHPILSVVLDLMVTEYQVQSALPVQLVHPVKDARVSMAHSSKALVLPQFVPITNFHIRESASIIVLECVQE